MKMEWRGSLPFYGRGSFWEFNKSLSLEKCQLLKEKMLHPFQKFHCPAPWNLVLGGL